MSKSALAGLPEATLGVFTSIRSAPEIASFTLNRRQPTGDAVTLSLELEMLAYP